MTLPKNVIQFCPKCGSNHFIYDGEKSFLCQTCSFHLFINSATAVAVLIENDLGEILLTVRAHDPFKGFFDLPGGFVDTMETVEAAVKREIKEELNLNVESMTYLISFPNEYVFGGLSVYTCDLGFVAKVNNFKEIHAEDDISDFIFVPKNEIDYSKISSLSIQNIIKYYIEEYK